MNGVNNYRLSDSELKELHGILLEIYCDVAEVCSKYNLRMLLGGGSCLGAIRHKGFIPWDDDMDLLMPRHDFDKLMELFDKELTYKYHLVDLEKTHSGQNLFAKIMKKDTIFLERGIDKDKTPAGIYVDLFPIESLPDNRFLRSIYLVFARMFTKLILIIIDYQLTNFQIRYKDKAAYRIIGRLTSFMSVYKWNSLYSVFISACKGTKYCFLPSGGHGVYAELLPVDTYFPLSQGIFEGIEVNLPNKYDSYLKNLYGDYMKLPPADKQKGVHSIVNFSTNQGNKENEAVDASNCRTV